MIGLITQGAIEIEEPRRKEIAACGQVVLYNFDQVHWGRSVDDDGWTINATYLCPQFLTRTAREAGATPRGTIGLSSVVANDISAAAKIKQLYALGDNPQEGFARSTLLCELTVEVLARHSDLQIATFERNGETRSVRLARDFLNDNFSTTVCLNALANECGINRYRLIKAFKSTWGMKWSRLSEQQIRIDKWNACRVRLPCGLAAR
jgi:hypothetical protein